MRRRVPILLFTLGLAIAFAGRAGDARALSDRLVVTDIASGSVVFDASLDEGSETDLFFQTGATGVIIFLTEPAGEPQGSEAPVFLPGTNIVVSDVLYAGPADAGSPYGLHLELFSDGNPNFPSAVFAAAEEICPFGTECVSVEETGELQDLTSPIHSDDFGLKVEVQSDVVPEPDEPLLLGGGLAGLAALRRRGTRR